MEDFEKSISRGVVITILGVITSTIFTEQLGLWGFILVCIGGFLTIKGMIAKKKATSS